MTWCNGKIFDLNIMLKIVFELNKHYDAFKTLDHDDLEYCLERLKQGIHAVKYHYSKDGNSNVRIWVSNNLKKIYWKKCEGPNSHKIFNISLASSWSLSKI